MGDANFWSIGYFPILPVASANSFGSNRDGHWHVPIPGVGGAAHGS
jgi:hypothetical protein